MLLLYVVVVVLLVAIHAKNPFVARQRKSELAECANRVYLPTVDAAIRQDAQKSAKENRGTKMIVAILVSYIVLWGPYLVNGMMTAAGDRDPIPVGTNTEHHDYYME